jgi:hypothetical protein
MYPELIEQIECARGYHHLGGDAEQIHRDIKNPPQQEPGTGLAQGSTEVIVLTLVMRHVCRPENGALVPQAMQPVVTEIVEHDCEHPGGPVTGIQQRQGEILSDQVVNVTTQAERHEAPGLTEHSEKEAAAGVVQPVRIASDPKAVHQLHQQGQDKERYGVNNQLHRAWFSLHAVDKGIRAGN